VSWLAGGDNEAQANALLREREIERAAEEAGFQRNTSIPVAPRPMDVYLVKLGEPTHHTFSVR
jgi:hypothetical protein